MRNQFYMVLPSNSSMKVYPDNTTSCYTTKLPQEINLRGKWEVGIVEIHFPRSFLHLRRDARDVSIISSLHPLLRDLSNKQEEEIHKIVSIPYGLYANIVEFLERLNTVLIENNTHLIFKFSISHNNTFVFMQRTCDSTTCDYEHSVKMSRDVLDILGFANESGYVRASSNPSIATRPANDLNALPRQLYVYTDICEPSIVGDVQASLLRIAPVSFKDYVFASNQHQTFSPVNYIPLLRNTFHTIIIDIRDQLGRAIPFECGTSTVTLHFRQID